MSSRAPTGRDVARRAGVSQAMVSLVMAGKSDGRISPERRDLVLRVAQELGYRPNPAARSLRLGVAHSVALIVPNVANPFFASVLLGAERAAREHRYAVMLLDTGEDPNWQDWISDVVASRSIDGCIVYAADPVPASFVRALGRNVVLVEARSRVASTIQLDIAGGTRAAMRHLLGLGHTRIAHLAAAYPKATFAARQATYRRMMAAASLPSPPALEVESSFAPEEATAAAGSLLSARPTPTAIFCDDDLLAAGVYKAASALGLRIPDDISVVGFDDIDVARLLQPELTTVAIPAEAVGRLAMSSLLSLIQSGHTTSMTTELKLRVRGSTSRL
jgi:DNA-binding LacI/PurR family transcriptional regulator